MAIAAIVIFVGVYVLLVTDKIHRTALALGGASLMLLLQISDPEIAFFSEDTGIEWNVIFLLLGMMMIVSVLRNTGVFEFVAIWAAKRTRGRPYALMVMLCVLTAVASALLDNVTTILLIAPVTFLVCDRLGLRPVPYLMAEVFASNIGGAATLVGDPPNIIIAARADLTFNDFLVHMLPIVVVLMVVFCLLCRWLFRREFSLRRRAGRVGHAAQRAAGDHRQAPAGAVPRSCSSSWSSRLRAPPRAALRAVGGRAARRRAAPADLEGHGGRGPRATSSGPPWPSSPGLFIMVGGLVETGVIGNVAEAAADSTEGRLGLATMVLLGGSAGLSAIVDNIPYVATMSPIVSELVAGQGSDGQVLWWALALGADLGGNATASRRLGERRGPGHRRP